MAAIDAAFWRLGDLLRQATGASAPQVTGRCVRTDPDGTAWVEVQGNPDPVPVEGGATTYDEGDEVTLSMDAGVPKVTSNVTSPAASMGAVRKAVRPVVQLASDAKAIAEATGQYFWHDTNGAHISTEEGNPTGPQNAIWNSLGMLFRTGATNLLAIIASSNSGIEIYDGEGNTSDNVVASLRKNAIKLWSRAQGYTTQIAITASAINMYIDETVGNPRNVMKLTTGSSKIDSTLTVRDARNTYNGTLKIGDPDYITSSFDATNVATSTNKSLGHVTLGAGVWVVVALVAFPANTTGIRRIGLSDTNNSMPSSGPVIQMNASTAGPTRVFLTWFIDNGTAPSGAPFITTPLYLTAYQTSGSTLSCSGHIRAVHIS